MIGNQTPIRRCFQLLQVSKVKFFCLRTTLGIRSQTKFTANQDMDIRLTDALRERMQRIELLIGD